jgi:transposase
MRIAPTVVVSDEQRERLETWSRGRMTPARLVLRAKIVLLAAAGRLNKDIAAELGTGMKTVCLWRKRFVDQGLAGLEKDAPRGGRPSTGAAELAREIVRKTTTETPAGATHWSTRTLAAELGVSPSRVQRVWKANRLEPHRVKTHYPSNDPEFSAQPVAVDGLHVNPIDGPQTRRG